MSDEPLDPVSPAEILREEFGLDWDGAQRIDQERAEELSRQLGPSPEFFLNLQKRWDEVSNAVS